MKILYLLLLVVYLLPGQTNLLKKNPKPNTDSILIIAKKQKEKIDKYLYKHQKQLIVLAKVVGKKNLVSVKNENWPDDTEYTYGILKNDSGKIIRAMQIPYSQSGDWYIEYVHYFDENGKIFAFSKRESVFDDSVKGGVAVEEDITYYDADFKTIKYIFRLTDMSDKIIKRNKAEFDFREYKYNIYKNLQDWLKGSHFLIH